MKEIPTGFYQHYKSKSKLYQIVGVGLDTVTNKQAVIYKPCYPCNFAFFTRPLAEFTDTIPAHKTAKPVARFTKVFHADPTYKFNPHDEMNEAFKVFTELTELCPYIASFDMFMDIMHGHPGYFNAYSDAAIRAIYWYGKDKGLVQELPAKTYPHGSILLDTYLKLTK